MSIARMLGAAAATLTSLTLALAAALPAAAQSAKWKIATVVAPPSILGILVDEMAAGVGKATGDRVQAERHQIPNEQEIAQNVIRGRVEMAYISATGLGVAVPEMGVMNTPYLWLSDAERDQVTDREAVPLLEKILDARGLVLIRAGEAGWTSVFCKTACTRPEQFKGMKVRVSPTASARLFYDRLGAIGSQMALSDFYPALQQGVVDAGDLTFSFYLITPAAQAAPHYVFTKHSHQPAYLVANKQHWNKLEEADRKAIIAGVMPVATLRARVAADELPKIEAHKAKGGFIHLLSDADRKVWADLVVPGHGALVDSYGGRARELFEAIARGKQDFAAGKR